MKIAVIGSGYVGLVSGTCFADFGHHVTCVDNSVARIEALERGEIPIYEPGLDKLVAENVAAGRLFFTTDLAAPVAEAEAVFIAVGTPSRHGDGHADLSYVYQAARDIASALSGFTVVINKSTVPVGTGDEVERIIRDVRPDAEFAVASNPEFLREGAAIEDFKRPDRIVVGIEDERARDVLAEIYRPLSINQSPLVFTRRRTAELIKYAANAFLAMKITFINEIADLCEIVGADVQDVAHGIGLDKRIGSKFLHAGPGYGGSCFPKDTLALAKIAQDVGGSVRLVETTIAVNDQRKRSMARRVIAACGGSVRKRRIGVLGLTFKPNTDDLRYSPAISVIQALQDNGAIVSAYDPKGLEGAAEALTDVTFGNSPYEVAEGAEALVLATEWDAFRALDFERLKKSMAQPLLIDLRNVYGRADVERFGFTYIGVGRPTQSLQNPVVQAAE
ncbi:MAG: UDP-glucose 6-dehydrogenase [Ancylobacter novellus]|uniref:UDP-glucose 6-dehydrogenase n=1 Tax=Ancylobacter novellus TaxID=921 RepID=A0A2W5M0G8_ANCNO|nr:MAG: UDP-glucose 6-dehydrogenase [Ancylobacter novellus]